MTAPRSPTVIVQEGSHPRPRDVALLPVVPIRKDHLVPARHRLIPAARLVQITARGITIRVALARRARRPTLPVTVNHALLPLILAARQIQAPKIAVATARRRLRPILHTTARHVRPPPTPAGKRIPELIIAVAFVPPACRPYPACRAVARVAVHAVVESNGRGGPLDAVREGGGLGRQVGDVNRLLGVGRHRRHVQLDHLPSGGQRQR